MYDFAPILLAHVMAACGAGPDSAEAVAVREAPTIPMTQETMNDLQTAVFGAGCFWCVEAVFEELKGVHEVTSGFMGGHVKNPSYKEVVSGRTGHAEVARITFDPTVIGYAELLEVFWLTHDPTTPDRQGADVGTQYRSAVFAMSDEQLEMARAYKTKLDESGAFPAPIVTEVVPAGEFYPAEGYHQDYYTLNPDQGYCRMVIRPKLEKFRKVFADKLK